MAPRKMLQIRCRLSNVHALLPFLQCRTLLLVASVFKALAPSDHPEHPPRTSVATEVASCVFQNMVNVAPSRSSSVSTSQKMSLSAKDLLISSSILWEIILWSQKTRGSRCKVRARSFRHVRRPCIGVRSGALGCGSLRHITNPRSLK